MLQLRTFIDIYIYTSFRVTRSCAYISPAALTPINSCCSSALSFLTAHGAVDQAQNWESLDSSKRKSLKSKYSSAGIKLIVSAFGSEEAPTTKGSDPVKTANDMANWVKKNDLDGIDVDYEDFDAMGKEDGKAEEWLSRFTKALREQLPRGEYILTHARE